MKITIASGKGGTGKTSVACALADALEREVCLFDCDVEEPNAHLFFKSKNEIINEVSLFVPKVIQEKCNLCLQCEEVCQFNAILNIADVMTVFPDMCHSCLACKILCKQNAIVNSSKVIGTIHKFVDGKITLSYGKLKIGEPMSPPLINFLKKDIDNNKINIIDAPPGTSCPVISTLKNSDYTILVTEPTPFGLNDLILAIETVKTLKIPFGIIINRADLGDDRVVKYAKKENIEILMQIPNKIEIAKAYSKGEIITKGLPALKDEFKKVYNKIKTLKSFNN